LKLTPSQKGAIAEAAFAAASIRLGLLVLRPACEGARYDLLIDLDPDVIRVQCKWARRVDGVLIAKLDTSRCTPNGYVRSTYTAREVDAIGVYSDTLRQCFLIPITEVERCRAVHLRLDPTLNNQALGIRWARDYELEASIRRNWPQALPSATDSAQVDR
jgi:PD-(D/E)XK endonuclease